MTEATPFWHRKVWDGIEAVVTNPDVLALLFAWRALARNNNAGLPDLADFALHEDHVAEPLQRFAPMVMVLESLPDGDFQYLHYGIEISRHSQTPI